MKETVVLNHVWFMMFRIHVRGIYDVSYSGKGNIIKHYPGDVIQTDSQSA